MEVKRGTCRAGSPQFEFFLNLSISVWSEIKVRPKYFGLNKIFTSSYGAASVRSHCQYCSTKCTLSSRAGHIYTENQELNRTKVSVFRLFGFGFQFYKVRWSVSASVLSLYDARHQSVQIKLQRPTAKRSKASPLRTPTGLSLSAPPASPPRPHAHSPPAPSPRLCMGRPPHVHACSMLLPPPSMMLRCSVLIDMNTKDRTNKLKTKVVGF